MSAVPLRIPVRLPTGGYNVWIGFNFLRLLGPALQRLDVGTHAVVLSHGTLRPQTGRVLQVLRGAGFSASFITVADTERSKSMAALARLLETIARRDGPGKRLFLVAVGGGVVGDLGGVAAGLYRRGIPCVQVPTTLLAQVDSAIGGKTGVDLKEGKNLVGLFHQPKIVFIDLSFLKTLSLRQFRSGLAEVAKCGVIQDPKIFSFLERTSVEKLRRSPALLTWLVARTVRVKVSLVEKDERELFGIRTLLNFGHTFGHALEAATHYSRNFTHGEAVAIGMRAATELSRRLNLIASRDAKRITRLLQRMGLPTVLRDVPLGGIERAMAHDKKWAQGCQRWVLPTRIGKALVRSGIPSLSVRAAIVSVMEE